MYSLCKRLACGVDVRYGRAMTVRISYMYIFCVTTCTVTSLLVCGSANVNVAPDCRRRFSVDPCNVDSILNGGQHSLPCSSNIRADDSNAVAVGHQKSSRFSTAAILWCRHMHGGRPAMHIECCRVIYIYVQTCSENHMQ